MTSPSFSDVTAVGLLQEPARRALYEWVASQTEPVGREQAARAVGVTKPLATFHLDKLADAGLLEAGYRRLSGKVGPGAGRPARVYWRAAQEFSVTVPERRYTRAAGVFAAALERIGHDGLPPELVESARASGAELGRMAGRGAAPTRLRRALEAGGYEPVTGDDGVIRLRNCPYDALVQEHRQLVCGTNLALAQGITDTVGVADLEPVLDPRPGFCCVVFQPRGGAASPP